MEESEQRTEADTRKRLSDIKNEKNKAQEIIKQWKDLGRYENIRGNMKVTLGIKTKSKA